MKKFKKQTKEDKNKSKFNAIKRTKESISKDKKDLMKKNIIFT